MHKKAYLKQYKQFIATLKYVRVSSGFTQAEAAQLMGKHQSFISKCESGERRVDIVELLEFCRIYKVKPSIFLSTGERSNCDG